MEVAVVDGMEIAYRVAVQGPPVVLIHAAGLADFFAALHSPEWRCHQLGPTVMELAGPS